MQKYRRVALKDRIEIQSCLKAGQSCTEIAKALGFHKSTILREVKRHQDNGNYSASLAQESANRNFISCRRPLKLKGELLEFTLRKLETGWSPDQIERRLKMESSHYHLSYQSIYRYIHRMNLRKTHLLYGYKRRGFGSDLKRKSSRNGAWKLSIHDRPEEANHRTELGHWERDTIFDKHRRSVLILTDRKSRLTVLAKNPSLKSKAVSRRTKRMLKNMPLKTITNDNGSEFFDVKSLKVPTYFCDVLKPGQRGTVENTIGLLRRYLKREMDLSQVSQQRLKILEREINLRPRKCLDYRTPYEVFYNKKVALAV